MHVRFCNRGERLLVSLIQARRVDGKPRNEHIASFGSVPDPPSVDDRITFWQQLHERLAKLSNRVDAETQGKVLGAIHARIPMVVIDEQRDVQVRNAEADAQFWSSLRDMHVDTVEDQKALAATVASAIAEGQAAADKAAAEAATAKDRVERLKRGEAVPSGIGKPMTHEDFIKMFGWTASDLRHMDLVCAMHEAGLGDEAIDEFCKRREASRKASYRAAARVVLRRRRAAE